MLVAYNKHRDLSLYDFEIIVKNTKFILLCRGYLYFFIVFEKITKNIFFNSYIEIEAKIHHISNCKYIICM